MVVPFLGGFDCTDILKMPTTPLRSNKSVGRPTKPRLQLDSSEA